MFLPSSSLPFISAMAFNMACSSAKVTKPKPLDLPVSRSEMTLLCVTSPKELKALSSRLSSVAHARPPTKHRYSDSPIFFREKKKKNHPTSALNSKLQTQHTRLQTRKPISQVSIRELRRSREETEQEKENKQPAATKSSSSSRNNSGSSSPHASRPRTVGNWLYPTVSLPSPAGESKRLQSWQNPDPSRVVRDRAIV